MLSECSLFSFCVSKERAEGFARATEFGGYVFSSDAKTPVTVISKQERALLLLGYAVHVETGLCEQALLADMLERTADLRELLRYEANVGGKYILLYREGEQYYALPDATASVPLFYMTVAERGTLLCSHSQRLVDSFSLRPDKTLLKIRESGEISQAMPYDVTEYAEIKQLLPNHYLKFSDGAAARFLNFEQEQEALSPEEAVEVTAGRIAVLAEYYAKRFKLYCPITGGKDSRVVLAFLLAQASEPIDAYTIRHAYHKGTEIDLTTPPKIAETVNIRYRQICDREPSAELVEYCDAVLGRGRYSHNTLMIANTVQRHYGDGAIINGDIIGQVGKCSLHRDIPQWLATAGYFRCKLHNYSRESKRQLRRWLKQIRRSGERVSSFDLFSVENRMGRWAGQENLIYHTVGQMYLNIFNARSIIYAWTAVERKKRKNSDIHVKMIEKVFASLMKIPFEDGGGFLKKICKSNGATYYISSYLKFYCQKLRFRKK